MRLIKLLKMVVQGVITQPLGFAHVSLVGEQVVLLKLESLLFVVFAFAILKFTQQWLNKYIWHHSCQGSSLIRSCQEANWR